MLKFLMTCSVIAILSYHVYPVAKQGIDVLESRQEAIQQRIQQQHLQTQQNQQFK